MSTSMTKSQFLDALRKARAEWDSLLAQVDKTRMTEPGFNGHWSVKDLIAHVTWYEREMVGVIHKRALVGSDWWALPQDERNALIFEANRDRPLNDVLEESSRVYRELEQALETLSDEDFNDPTRFAEMPPDWLPWEVIASNCFEHYPQHIPNLQRWLAGN